MRAALAVAGLGPGQEISGTVTGLTALSLQNDHYATVPVGILQAATGVTMTGATTMAHSRRPNLMVMLTFFVGLGVLLTSVVQATEKTASTSIPEHTAAHKLWPGQWLQNLGVSARPKSWKPVMAVGKHIDGLRVGSLFGARGPDLQVSASMPEHVKSSLRDGGDSMVGFRDDSPDAYLFLHKRW